jgi:mannose-6-phosphate isomerase
MLRLANQTQDYAWGSPDAIPVMLGSPATSDPVAELWMGAHPSAPSRAITDTGPVRLDDLVRADPERMLGSAVHARFGPALPYLLKVIAADAPLSLQVHPRIDQAEAGFDAEEAAGVPITSPDRSYKDRNHKPELLYALTPFEALCGFRAPSEAAELLAGLDAPLAHSLRAVLESSGGVHAAVIRLLDGAQRPTSDEVDAVVLACRARPESAMDPDAYRTAALLAEAYPGDPGVVMSLLLNHLTLRPGDALFVPAGAVHSYLQGVGIEIQSSSDNVLRAGLTPKHLAIPELLATIDCTPGPPHRIVPEAVSGSLVFRAPVDDFELSVTTLDDDAGHALPGTGPRILLCLDGELTVASDEEGLVLGRGATAFVPAALGALTVSGHGTLIQADVP